jgi:hypothetical protein
MADQLRVKIGIDVIDEYLEASSYSDDRQASAAEEVDHTSGIKRYRYVPDYARKIGCEFAKDIGDAQAEAWGIYDGNFLYFLVLSGTTIGVTNEVYQFLYVRHTGHAWYSNTVLGDAIGYDLIIEKQTAAGGSPAYEEICTLKPGQFMFLPNTHTNGSGHYWRARSSTGSSVAMEYAVLRPDL